MSGGAAIRLAVLADLSDPYAAGIALVFLHHLRVAFAGSPLYIVLLGLAPVSSPLPASFHANLSGTLNAVSERNLLRQSEKEPPFGADAMYLLSLPSSMMESTDAYRIPALASARVLGRVFSAVRPPVGFHTLDMDGTLSLCSLGNEAKPFASFLLWTFWLSSDLLPSLRGYLNHPAGLKALAPNSRAGMFRGLFGADPKSHDFTVFLPAFETALRRVVKEIVSLLRAIPSSLRLSSETVSLWQEAAEACGRVVTVAAEYEVTREETRESGLDTVKPVHRDSLADTDEESLLRRVSEMAEQLEEESAARAKALSSLGGYRSLQVRKDCLLRCQKALEDTKKKVSSLPEDAPNLTVMRQARRIRLLNAAIERCRSELQADRMTDAVSALPAVRSSGPFDGLMIDAAVCEALLQYAESDPAAVSESSKKELSALLPLMFPGYPLSDSRALLKLLTARCRQTSPGTSPFTTWLHCALTVCREEVDPLRFFSVGGMPSVDLLPDLFPDEPLTSLENVLSSLPLPADSAVSPAEKRGLLAMLLLCQYRRRESGDSQLHIAELKPEMSPVLQFWLSSRRASEVHILSLQKSDEMAEPFALVLPGRTLIPARRTGGHALLVPAFVTWFDASASLFHDPCVYLGEGDRKLLSELLSGMVEALEAAGTSSLTAFLKDFLQALSADTAIVHDSHLKTRLQAACGLYPLPAYAGALCRKASFYEHFLTCDQVASSLTGRSNFPASTCLDLPDEVLYTWHGIPFAREHSSLLLECPDLPLEDHALNTLESECRLLFGSSDDFRDSLVKEIRQLLERCPDALEDRREQALSLLAEAEKPLPDQSPRLFWPWDPSSPSVLTLLRECLGDSMASAASRPFSDVLALAPARGRDIIGDSLFSSMCVLVPESHPELDENSVSLSPDAILPPLSPSFAEALCTRPEGRVLLDESFLRFERKTDSVIRVTVTLNGAFPFQLIRDYPETEIVHLYSHDIPTLAVWPSIPFRSGSWNAYFVYAHCADSWSVSVLPEGGCLEELPETSPSRRADCLRAFPVCFALYRDGLSAGCIPNLLPEPASDVSAPVTVCLDFGSSAASVVFSSGHQLRPLRGPVMVRTILNNPSASQDLLRREFLPAVPVSALLPTVTRIFRNVPGASPVPFVDGAVLMASDLQDLLSTPSEAIYTSLKWEEEKGRSGILCLHQIMLMAALQARYEGAPEISWRFALPDEMAKEGRESLMGMFLSLTEQVMQESAFPVPASGLPAAFASENTALGAYFRFCASDDTRGGFMVMDIGSSTADISLFMRGREQAVRSVQIPLGMHYMLVPSLLRNPGMLLQDFASIPDGTFLQDLRFLTEAFSKAMTDPAALRRARLSLDYFIADHSASLLSYMLQMASSGVPTRLGSLLLLFFSYLMMLSGLVLLQIAADPNKNDFLPEQMSLCLSGRGAGLLESLPDSLKSSLWRFLTMFRNRRVASLSFLFSAEKKMEIPVGLSLLREVYHMLPPASSVPASIAVRPEELLPEFLLRFHREFPMSSDLLFPDFFTDVEYHPFTDRGEFLVSASLEQSFQRQETPRPYNSLAAWIGNLLDLLGNYTAGI